MMRRAAGCLAVVLGTACGPSYVPEVPAWQEEAPPAPTTVALDEGLDPPPVREPRDTGIPAPWETGFSRKLEEKYFHDFDAVLLTPSGEIITVKRGTLRVHAQDGKVLRSASAPRVRAAGFTAPEQLTLVHEDGFLHFTWPDLVRRSVKTDVEIRSASMRGNRIAVVVGETFSKRRRVRILEVPLPPAGGAPTNLQPKVVDWFDLAGDGGEVRLSPEGGRVAVARRHDVILRDVVRRREIMRYPSDDYLDGVVFSPDGERLLIGADPPEEIRATDGGAIMVHSYGGSVDGVAFVKGQAVVYDYRTLRFLGEGGQHLEFRDTAFSERGDVVCGQSDEEHYRCLALAYEAPAKLTALPTDAPPAEPPLVPPKPVPAPTPPARTTPPGYAKLFSIPSGRASGLFLSPKGDSLLAWSHGSTLAIHDPKTGRVLRTAAVCTAHDWAYGFAGPSHFVGICEDKVVRYGWPSFAEQATIHLPNDMNSGAMGTGHFAVDVEDKPRIVIYRLSDMKQKYSFATDGVIVEDSMVMSANGKRLAYATKGGVWIHDLSTRKTHKIMSTPHGDLALSADGAKVLVVGSNLQEVSGKDGSQLRAWSENHISSMAYVGDEIAIAGFDGFTVLSGPGGSAAEWVEADRGFVAGHSNGTVCLSADKQLSCFGPKPKKP